MAWAALAFLAVAVGVFARWAGSPDTRHPRLNARKLTGEGIEALLGGDFTTARAHLDLAVRTDPELAEARLARALAELALGATADALRDAIEAERRLAEGGADPRAWREFDPDPSAPVETARRLRCLIEAAEGAKAGAYAPAVRLFLALGRAQNCEAYRQTFMAWHRDAPAQAILRRAHVRCPSQWPCRLTSERR